MLDYSFFIHPKDAKALDALKKVPGLPQLTRKFNEIFYERAYKVMNLSQKIKLSEKQIPEIYNILPPICEKLEIPIPELYLEQNPTINAYTFGDKNPFITIHSGLLNYCSKDVITAIIAHECGHIACHHTLYKSMANFFLGVGAEILPIPFLKFALKYSLLYWDRCSEYSADRVSAYVMGGSESVVSTMKELGSGLSKYDEQLSEEEFLKQAEDFNSFSDESGWNKFLMYYQLIETDHPFLTDRANSIVEWCNSDIFNDLCKNGIPKNSELRCPNCNAAIDSDSVFCGYCGCRIY